jgi:hypothetical protein
MNVFSDLRQVGSFLRVLRIIPNKTDRHHIIPRVFFAYNTLKLWVRVMVFNVTLKQYVNYMVAISFIGNNPQYPKKTTNLPQVTEYIHHFAYLPCLKDY